MWTLNSQGLATSSMRNSSIGMRPPLSSRDSGKSESSRRVSYNSRVIGIQISSWTLFWMIWVIV